MLVYDLNFSTLFGSWIYRFLWRVDNFKDDECLKEEMRKSLKKVAEVHWAACLCKLAETISQKAFNRDGTSYVSE